MTNAPNVEQLQALNDYAADHGPEWKTRLRSDWRRGGSRWHGPYALLQQVRNQFGPAWLADFTPAAKIETGDRFEDGHELTRFYVKR